MMSVSGEVTGLDMHFIEEKELRSLAVEVGVNRVFVLLPL